MTPSRPLPVHARLPPPTVDGWSWQTRAACRGKESALFFGHDGEHAHARRRREAHAKRLCERCPVLARCRAHALRVGEPYGVWGGLSAPERQALLGHADVQIPVSASGDAPAAAVVYITDNDSRFV